MHKRKSILRQETPVPQTPLIDAASRFDEMIAPSKKKVLGLAAGEVSSPCGSSQFPGCAVDDKPILVLWFREGSATPILNADARRGGGLANGKEPSYVVIEDLKVSGLEDTSPAVRTELTATLAW
ncbi:hypothetical protein HPB50_008660 [Hyalomma asiaticum]|uniref:Uncharacterized protein n=1 Tax=Hyalomma asiaticum TaxID=266040 RepID=A0ACB7S4H3_HYAAI|nr:hypothetical protein HPB50_008660 [Hyalomma asiaticum]